jgi:hypothetical protein
MFVFGNQVMAGMLGTNPQLPSSVTVDDNVAMQYDFRSVYATLLQDWFCVPSSDLNSILLNNYQTLPLVNNTDCTATALREIDQAAGNSLLNIYPNPFMSSTNINFTTNGGHTLIQAFDCEGQLIKTLVDKEMAAGNYKVGFENEGYPTGNYYIRLQNRAVQQVKAAIIVR